MSPHTCLSGTLLLLLCFAPVVTGTPDTPPAEKYFYLVSRHSRYTLGVRYFLKPELGQDLFRHRSTQQFTLVPCGEPGWFFIRTVYNRHLDVNSVRGELIVVQQTRTGSDSQKWKIEGTPDACRVLNKKEQQVITVRKGSLPADAGIVLVPLSADTAQTWRLWEALPIQPRNYSLPALVEHNGRTAELASGHGILIRLIDRVLHVPHDASCKSSLYQLLQQYTRQRVAEAYLRGFSFLETNDLKQTAVVHAQIRTLQQQLQALSVTLGIPQPAAGQEPDPLLEIFLKRLAMGEIRPRVVQKIGVLFVKHLDINQTCSQNRRWIKKLTITPLEYAGSIFQQRVLKALLEIHSRGNLSLEFRRYTPDLTMRQVRFRYMPYIMCDADLDSIVPDSSDILYDILKNCDTLVTIFPAERGMTSGGTGGSTHPVLLQYHSHGPGRLFMNLPAFWGQFSWPGGLLHEYMHTAEVALGRFIALMHCTPESFEKLKKQDPDYPGWKTNDKSELNYLAWHLQHTVPKSAAGKPGEDVHTGWNSFALARRRPLLMDRALFEYHRQQILRVPPENRKLSKEILQQAHQAWQAGRKEQSDSLYRRAMTINPACYDAYRHFGNRYETWGKFTEAVAYMQKYISFTQDSNYCYRAGSILASRLGRYAEAEALFSLGIRSLGNDNRRKAQLCVRATLVLLQAGQYRPARTIALQGVGLDPASKTLECEFLAGECAFRSGDKQAGLAEIRSALNKGLRNNSWYAHRLKRWSWGLLNAGNLPDALALAEAGSLVADAGCRNQCIFQKGESLFKLGHKEEGMRLMRSVLEPLGKWWQQRFVRVTGRR